MESPVDRLALRFMVDNHIIDDEKKYPDSPMPRLREMSREGWFYLAISDVYAPSISMRPKTRPMNSSKRPSRFGSITARR